MSTNKTDDWTLSKEDRRRYHELSDEVPDAALDARILNAAAAHGKSARARPLNRWSMALAASLVIALGIGLQWQSSKTPPRAAVQAGGVADPGHDSESTMYCSSAERASAERWLKCIKRLQQDGKQAEAAAEERIYRRTFGE